MSLVKGGGKAIMSSKAEEMIISLLYDTRQSNNPLLPKTTEHGNADDGNATTTATDTANNDDKNDDKNENGEGIKDKKSKKKTKKEKRCSSKFDDLSDHDKKKEKKRFIKRLVKCHNHQMLTMKLNSSNNKNNNGGIDKEDVDVDQKSKQQAVAKTGFHGNIKKKSDSEKPKSDKVRIDIVEAIYKNDKSSSSSSTKKSKKSSSSSSKSSKKKWKEGTTRKTIVVSRYTKVKEFMNVTKSKLKMKKPTRMFYVDKDSKLEMDILYDLSGLDDGSIVYVTSHIVTEKIEMKAIAEGEGDGEKEGEEEDAITIIDPLESVKKAYNIQKRKRPHSIKKKKSLSIPINGKLPPFATSLENLESLSEARSKLPAANYRSEILTSLDTSRVVVICGATGCGKSTQIPQYILEGMKAIKCETRANILVTQPRRVAATSLAMRVSNERCSPSPGSDGSEVGYNVRLSKAISDSTKITYCTVGILLRMLVNPIQDEDGNGNGNGNNDGADEDESGDSKDTIKNQKTPPVPLSHISHVIIDEVHERDLNTDFALTLLRPLLCANKNISVILMSATASSELFVNYFRSYKLNIEPKVFKIPGRTFPVETKWLSHCEKIVSKGLNGWSNDFINEDESSRSKKIESDVILSPRATAKIDNDFITDLIKILSKQQWEKDKSKCNGKATTEKDSGAILVFLPGKGEIQALVKTLSNDSSLGDRKRCSILQLHSSLSPREQWLAFQPVKYGIVKVILATNVAETSITIPDVSTVIDTGRVKESRFNSSTRIRELVTVWTSQASVKQRAGRAGRTGPGICYKLYSEEFTQKMMLPQTPPEIVRTPLEELVLQVCLMKEHEHSKGTSPMKFLSQAPEPPSESRLSEACDHLLQIGALSPNITEDESIFRLTPLGYHLAHLPMDPKVGKILIVGCVLQCVEPALTIAATLSCSKSCWLPYLPGVEDSKDKAREAQAELVRDGFGGENWPYGTVKGDLIGVIAAYNAWYKSSKHEKEKKKFANQHGLDNNALIEMKGLRTQFKDALRVSGLWTNNSQSQSQGPQHEKEKDSTNSNLDALLTSCCLVAGLYPNIATLMRPSREKRIFSGRLITKEGDSCRASSSSFQCQRIKNAAESGKDAYAVYHSKHRSIGTSTNSSSTKNQRAAQQTMTFLSEINFVSRFAILLFGGEIQVQKNYLLVDEWLKFKVVDDTSTSSKENGGEKVVGREANALLIQELRRELDNVLLKRIVSEHNEEECERVVDVVRKLLSEE